MAAVLNVVKEDEVSVNPLLVQFTNGDVQANSNDCLKFTLFESSTTEDVRKKFRKTLVAQTDKMKYSGSNFGMAARSNSLCKYLVGVYDKRSGNMDVYNTTTFKLQPKISNDINQGLDIDYHYHCNYHQLRQSADETDAAGAPSNLSFMEKVKYAVFNDLSKVMMRAGQVGLGTINDRLVEAFGSTKRKKAMKSRLQNMIDSEELGHSVSSAVNHMMSQPEHNGDQASSSVAESDMFPSYNKDGQTAAEIYPLSSILNKADFDALKSPAVELISQLKTLKETWRRENKFPQYVMEHLDVLPVNDNDRIRKASCLLYFSYLLRCYQLNYKSLRVKDPLPDLSSRIKDKIFSSFSLQQKNTRCIPKRLKDKLVCYIIVLALIMDGYTIDCQVLCKDLKMALQRFCNFARSVGCTIESNQGIGKRKFGEDGPAGFKLAILQVPLPKDFPNHIALVTKRK